MVTTPSVLDVNLLKENTNVQSFSAECLSMSICELYKQFFLQCVFVTLSVLSYFKFVKSTYFTYFCVHVCLRKRDKREKEYL